MVLPEKIQRGFRFIFPFRDNAWAEAARLQGLLRELSPGPLAPEARIMPLDQVAFQHGSAHEYLLRYG